MKNPFKKMKNVNEIVEKVADTTKDIIKMGSAKEQTTERLKIDQLGDNWLSKSIRPITLIWFMALLTFLVICDSRDIDIKESIVKIIGGGVWAALGFYFVGRDILKNRRLNKKESRREETLDDQLVALKKLLDKGYITEEEYKKQKEKILNNS